MTDLQTELEDRKAVPNAGYEEKSGAMAPAAHATSASRKWSEGQRWRVDLGLIGVLSVGAGLLTKTSADLAAGLLIAAMAFGIYEIFRRRN